MQPEMTRHPIIAEPTPYTDVLQTRIVPTDMIAPSVYIRSGFEEDFWDRGKIMEVCIRSNLRVDKTKPMLYAGSGGDVLTFICSGVQEAYYVDPNIEGSTILSRVKKLFPDATVVQSEKGEITTAIAGYVRFIDDGTERKIYIDHNDAHEYVPEAIKQRGCSTYVTLGTGLEFCIPPVDADAYVVSFLVPTALGYSEVDNITYDPASLFAVAFAYTSSGLTPTELNAIGGENSTFLPNLLGGLTVFNEAQQATWRLVTQATGFLEMTYKNMQGRREVSEEIEEAVSRSAYPLAYLRKLIEVTMPTRLQGIRNLRPDLRKLVVGDIVKRLENFHSTNQQILGIKGALIRAYQGIL